jgi:hypothetical protein
LAAAELADQQQVVADLTQTYTQLGMAGTNTILSIATGSKTAKEAALSLLDTLARCRRESARLYVDGRKGVITASDCSKMASVLDLVSRLIERGELKARVAALEAAAP